MLKCCVEVSDNFLVLGTSLRKLLMFFLETVLYVFSSFLYLLVFLLFYLLILWGKTQEPQYSTYCKCSETNAS